MAGIVNIGELDTKVIVQKCVITSGTEAEAIESFVEVARPFAKVERRAADALVNENYEDSQTLTVTMYKIPGMTTRWRLVIDAIPYEISDIDLIDRMSPFCVLMVRTIER